MKTAYQDLDLQLLPDAVIRELSQKNDLISQIIENHQSFPTQLVSVENFCDSPELFSHFNQTFNLFFENFF